MKDFINKIEGKEIPREGILITMGVNLLCTHIAHDEVHIVVEKTLQQVPNLTFMLIELLDLILDIYYFRSEHQFYMQIKSMAIGSLATLSIANLFIISLQDQIICNKNNNLSYEYFLYYSPLLFIL